jgi:hypothetical protein
LSRIERVSRFTPREFPLNLPHKEKAMKVENAVKFPIALISQEKIDLGHTLLSQVGFELQERERAQQRAEKNNGDKRYKDAFSWEKRVRDHEAVIEDLESRLRDLLVPNFNLQALAYSDLFRAGGLHLLNASVIPVGCNGLWNVHDITPDEARRLHSWAIHTGPLSGDGWGSGVFSHIGHSGTAEAISLLHGTKVDVNRSPWDGNGLGLAFTLKARQREGEILTLERVMEVGFVWRVIYRG